MKDGLKKVSAIYHKFPLALLYRLHSRSEIRKQETTEQTLAAMCEYAKGKTDSYFSYRVRPKSHASIPVLDQKNEYEKCAIVLQGPIMSEANFTAETVRLYKKFYPDAIIIVSTWEDEAKENITNVRNAGAIVIQSKKPEFPGHGNVNFQLVNTRAGLFKARELGAKYICKVRTDQRLYHPNVLEYFRNLVCSFPIDKEMFSINQEARIVCLGMEYGNMFYPFFMSDFLYFGLANDICRLFDCELDMRESVPKPHGLSRGDVSTQNLVTEIQILRDYIRRSGGDSSCTVKNYWNFVKADLACINKDEIGLYWPKYGGQYCENTRNGYYFGKEKQDQFKCYNWDFINWLNLYSGTLKYKEEYEKYADFVIE